MLQFKLIRMGETQKIIGFIVLTGVYLAVLGAIYLNFPAVKPYVCL